jgi:hypothetical protein
MKIIKKAINAAAPRPVGKLTVENEEVAASEALAVLSKEARKTLKAVGSWHQDFDGNEIVSCMAMLLATNKVLADKQHALAVAINFIGAFEHHEDFGDKANQALKEINDLLVGASH